MSTPATTLEDALRAIAESYAPRAALRELPGAILLDALREAASAVIEHRVAFLKTYAEETGDDLWNTDEVIRLVLRMEQEDA